MYFRYCRFTNYKLVYDETNLLCHSNPASGTRLEYHQDNLLGIKPDDEYPAVLPRGVRAEFRHLLQRLRQSLPIWSVFTVKGEKYPPQEQNCGPVAGAILENFPEQVEAATSTCHWMNAPVIQ